MEYAVSMVIMVLRQNKELVRCWYEDVLSGSTKSRQYLRTSQDMADVDLNQMFARDYVNHVSPAPPGGWKNGVDAAKQIIMIYRLSAPDLSISVLSQVEERDLIATHYTVTGTHTAKSFFGVPATGMKYKVAGFGLDRIADGKIAESWGMWDTHALMDQMGILPKTTHLG